MAAITGTVITAAATAYSVNRQNAAARDAARAQAEGVASAQQQTEEATNRARRALLTGNPYGGYAIAGQNQEQLGMLNRDIANIEAEIANLQSQPPRTGAGGQIQNLQRQQQIQDLQNQLADLNNQAVGVQQQIASGQLYGAPGGQAVGTPPPGGTLPPGTMPPVMGGVDQTLTNGGGGLPALAGAQPGVTAENPLGQIAQPAAQTGGVPGGSSVVGYGDPFQNYLTGILSQSQAIGEGYQQAEDILSPLAGLAAPYLTEQASLLGLGGPEAYQAALSRVADPLAAEQERAMIRNNAALGGVGGNVLSALAEQTRARTESNIGNRLGQLASSGSPALNALQQISGMRLNRGLQMGDVAGTSGFNLAQMEENRRRALANLEVGQGSTMAQLAQNYGTALGGGAAYAAQNAPALAQGLTSGLDAYLALRNQNNG